MGSARLFQCGATRRGQIGAGESGGQNGGILADHAHLCCGVCRVAMSFVHEAFAFDPSDDDDGDGEN